MFNRFFFINAKKRMVCQNLTQEKQDSNPVLLPEN